MNDKLKPCPFCGGEAKMYRGSIWNSKVRWISCENDGCKIQPETPAYDNEDEAIEAWNIRAEIQEDYKRKAKFYYEQCKAYGIECFYDKDLEER